MNKEKIGFVQLVSPSGEVQRQVKGTPDTVEYCREHVWIEPAGGYKTQFVESSDLVEPWNFFRPVPRNAEVRIYSLWERGGGVMLDPKVEPIAERPLRVVVAGELEETSISRLIGTDNWNAYVNGDWAGTSEF